MNANLPYAWLVFAGAVITGVSWVLLMVETRPLATLLMGIAGVGIVVAGIIRLERAPGTN